MKKKQKPQLKTGQFHKGDRTMYKPRTLEAKEGYTYVSHNAKAISPDGVVLLGINADAEEWHEITISEAEALQKTWEAEELV